LEGGEESIALTEGIFGAVAVGAVDKKAGGEVACLESGESLADGVGVVVGALGATAKDKVGEGVALGALAGDLATGADG
jgi:hypothetical protein